MDNSQVRAFLNSLPSEADFSAFCLDYFPDAYRTFSAGMDRTQRSSLLIERCGAEAIATAWKHAHSSQVSVRGQHIFQLATPLSPHFTGRQEILALLRQQLAEHRMVALCGLGGLGKTQTVVAYAHRHHEQYPVVLWLAGDSAAHLDHGIFALGQPLMRAGLLELPFTEERDPTAVRRAVLDYLHYATNYLLICDNVDSPQTFGASWPNRSRLSGQVLLTSRSPDIRRLGAVVVDLTKLSDADAAAYLLRCHPAGSSAERQALVELSQELDGLPLALAQAAAFLTEHQSCYADYLRQYRKQRLSLLEQAIPQDYPSSVATTWSMNLEQVHRTCGASLDLLQLCALLHPGAIPEELFANPVVEMGDALHAALTAASQEDGDALAFDRLLKPLLGYALVQRDREKRLLFIHRLVQHAVLYRMPESSLKSRVHALLVQLDSVFPEPQFLNWGQCRRMLPQVLAMAGHIQRFCITSVAAGRLLHRAGHFLNDQGEYAEASQLCQRALAIRQEVLGDQHLDVAHSLKGLGVVLKNQGRLTEAEALFRRALTIREQALGSEHPDVADILNYLGRLLKNQGRQGDAEQLHRRALMVVENAIGCMFRAILTAESTAS